MKSSEFLFNKEKNSTYIFDFDGVICDSNHETFDNSLFTFLEFIKLNVSIEKKNELKKLYIKNRFIVRRPSEFPNLWNILLNKISLIEKIDFNKSDLHKYENLFFLNRKKYKEKNFNKWIKKNKIYEEVKLFINTKLINENFYIASTKDETSIVQILENNNITINPNKIYGTENYSDKKEMFQEICKYNKESNIIFLDDNILNLNYALDFKFKCFYATWGYGKSKYLKNKDIKNLYLNKLNEIFFL